MALSHFIFKKEIGVFRKQVTFPNSVWLDRLTVTLVSLCLPSGSWSVLAADGEHECMFGMITAAMCGEGRTPGRVALAWAKPADEHCWHIICLVSPQPVLSRPTMATSGVGKLGSETRRWVWGPLAVNWVLIQSSLPLRGSCCYIFSPRWYWSSLLDPKAESFSRTVFVKDLCHSPSCFPSSLRFGGGGGPYNCHLNGNTFKCERRCYFGQDARPTGIKLGGTI